MPAKIVKLINVMQKKAASSEHLSSAVWRQCVIALICFAEISGIVLIGAIMVLNGFSIDLNIVSRARAILLVSIRAI